jgi:hypothetical protein
MSFEREYIERPIWIAKWRRRWDVALDNFDRSGLAFVPQPSTVIIKGDASLQIQKAIYFKGDADFTSFAVYIKGDTSLIAERTTLIKGDTRFVTFATYFKGDATLAINVPLGDLGEDPPSTKPGAISRFWLSVTAVTKDVT